MINFILSILFFMCAPIIHAQTTPAVTTKPAPAKSELPFKYDQLYKTMYAKELCALLQKQPDLILIDVRTPGEYADTSRFASLNQGHLKGALNFNSETLKKDIAALNPYKDKTVVLYCSHSQRSRRISKLLSENGFSNFYNLNGGMSSLNQLTIAEFPCKTEWIVSNLQYKNYSVDQTMDLIKKEKELSIIDIRTANQFNSTDSLLPNNIGRIKGSINIPFDVFEKKIIELTLSKEKPILIVGETGDGNSARAAERLVKNDFKNVAQLLGGIDDFIATASTFSVVENASSYRLIDIPAALKLLQTNEKLIIYDTRTDEEYNNKITGMEAYKNLGHLKNAIHVTEPLFSTQLFSVNKEEQILVYGN